jgi:hypothetical protein
MTRISSFGGLPVHAMVPPRPGPWRALADQLPPSRSLRCRRHGPRNWVRQRNDEHEQNQWLQPLGGTRLPALVRSSTRHRGTLRCPAGFSRLSASTTLRCYCHRIQMLGRHALASDMIGDIVANPALRSAKDDDRSRLLAKQGSRPDRSSAQERAKHRKAHQAMSCSIAT